MPIIGHVHTSTPTSNETDGWDMDAAWKELEQARGAVGGRKKKAAKLVLTLNGGGAPAGRRR